MGINYCINVKPIKKERKQAFQGRKLRVFPIKGSNTSVIITVGRVSSHTNALDVRDQRVAWKMQHCVRLIKDLSILSREHFSD